MSRHVLVSDKEVSIAAAIAAETEAIQRSTYRRDLLAKSMAAIEGSRCKLCPFRSHPHGLIIPVCTDVTNANYSRRVTTVRECKRLGPPS